MLNRMRYLNFSNLTRRVWSNKNDLLLFCGSTSIIIKENRSKFRVEYKIANNNW